MGCGYGKISKTTRSCDINRPTETVSTWAVSFFWYNVSMIIVHHEKDTYILNVERGEELISTLRGFLKKESIRAGYFTGLGTAGELDLAYYNFTTKEFERHAIKEDVEILSLTGNIAILKNERIIHIHGTFGRKDLSVLGGHIFSLLVSGACEIHLTKLSGEMTRAYDEATGLNLLCSIPS